MSIDRADWHFGGNFPADLPPENGGTHIGMFLAWIIMNGLEGIDHQQDSPELLAAVRSRLMTGRQFLFRECDGKLWDVDLNEEGNAFARYYYAPPEHRYFNDYTLALATSVPTLYHVEDTWENYDTLAPVITKRFGEWKQINPPLQP